MNIIITGASAGIGYETALRFAENAGNVVFAVARRVEKLEELTNHRTGSRIIPVVTDIATYDFRLLLKLLNDNNVTTIDVLIHNAGMLINKPFEEIAALEWEELYRVNIIGVAQLTRALMPLLGGKNPSHIVNIGSIGGVRGSLKFSGLSAYSSSKGALGILTECLAEEFSNRNISVNCLALGSVQTEMLTKAFPGYTGSMSAVEVSRFIYDFSLTGWRHFNGKILEVSITNP
jgi:NAD(P)-dependent dehydrogenase (short-subunit alcohol dehydrogenase family)